MTHIKLVAAAAVAALTLPISPVTAQAKITWTVKDIDTAAKDISTKGKLCIALNCGPEDCEKVVNGVHFQADRSHWAPKVKVRNGPVVRGVNIRHDPSSGGFNLLMPYNRYAPNSGGRHAVEADYNAILKNVRHWPGSNPGTIKCSIEGLTPGNLYEIQIFFGLAPTATKKVAEWSDGQGNRGGVILKAQGPHNGQVATGTFTADKSGKQTFTNFQDNTVTPNHDGVCSAIQIRDISSTPSAARATYYGEGTPGTQTGGRNGLLGGSNCSPLISLDGHPTVNSSRKLLVENSQDVASAAVIVIGDKALNATLPWGGTLLVNPVILLPAPMPQPVDPYVHIGSALAATNGYELQVPLTMPGAPLTFYVQALQTDPNGPGGFFSWTAGMKVDVGP